MRRLTITFPLPSALLAGINHARLPTWALPDGWLTQANGGPVLADLAFRGGRIAALTLTDRLASGLWDLTGALTLPGLVEPHARLDKTFIIKRCRLTQAGLPAAIHVMHENRQHQTRADIQHRAPAALARTAANGVTRLCSHIDRFTTDAPDARQELARLDTIGTALGRVVLVPLTLFRDSMDAGAIARTAATNGEGCPLGGFIHSLNWDVAAMTNLLDSTARWDLDLDLYIDEELSEVSQGLTWLVDHPSRHPFPGHICYSHSCTLTADSGEQAAPILRQLMAHGVTLIALLMTNLLLQDVTFDHMPCQRGTTLLHKARAAGVAILVGCDNVQDTFCPAGSYGPLDTLVCSLLSVQFSDLFDRQSRLTCDRVALIGSLVDAAPLVIDTAASVMIFLGSDRFTWPLDNVARLVVNHGGLTHRCVWQEEVAREF